MSLRSPAGEGEAARRVGSKGLTAHVASGHQKPQRLDLGPASGHHCNPVPDLRPPSNHPQDSDHPQDPVPDRRSAQRFTAHLTAGGHPFRVLIVGAGVAGLEAALALRELAGERVALELLAPEPEFVSRPLRVGEPFSRRAAQHVPLADIARDIGAELIPDSFARLERDPLTIHTAGGRRLRCDAALLALGARPQPAFAHALTLDDRRLDEQLHGLIQDIEADYIHSLAFLIPTHMAWPLPAYELALMTARRAWDMNINLSITIATAEDAPLAVFGEAASRAVGRLLEEHGVITLPSAHPETPAPGMVLIHPGSRTLRVDRILALPRLVGPPAPGVPKAGEQAFIPIDEHGRVVGLERVYAAGDAVEFPVKHGGLAAQQADAAAEAIAALAGADITPSEFHPRISGLLLGGRTPLYMRAHITGGHGGSSEVSDRPLWTPPTKIEARYLSPYLEASIGVPAK